MPDLKTLRAEWTKAERRAVSAGAAVDRAGKAWKLAMADLKKAQKAYAKEAAKPVPMKTVTNLMSGQPVEIAEDTPLCCDPSSETYWSM